MTPISLKVNFERKKLSFKSLPEYHVNRLQRGLKQNSGRNEKKILHISREL